MADCLCNFNCNVIKIQNLLIVANYREHVVRIEVDPKPRELRAIKLLEEDHRLMPKSQGC